MFLSVPSMRARRKIAISQFIAEKLFKYMSPITSRSNDQMRHGTKYVIFTCAGNLYSHTICVWQSGLQHMHKKNKTTFFSSIFAFVQRKVITLTQ